jgi:putative transposase
MPRQARLIIPGVAAHIIQRGHNRAACFRVESDYRIYLLHLRELADKLGCEVHAYCLMTNHVHLLLTPPSVDACIALMRNLGQRYVQYFNKRHARTGTLWEGRFRSCVTESARYVLACYRYIEMNPVRAGMVRTPVEYPWSSHRANIGLKRDALVHPHVEYLALGGLASTPADSYLQLCGTAIDEALLRRIREATNGGYPIGGDAFLDTVAASAKRRLEPGKAGRPGKKKSKSSQPAGNRALTPISGVSEGEAF